MNDGRTSPMARKDFVFFLQLSNRENLSIAFCKFENNTKESAKEKITNVLINKNISEYQLNFLGSLSYEDMDPKIVNQLDYFEKHGEVWLLL
jgi:hypothetical protein